MMHRFDRTAVDWSVGVMRMYALSAQIRAGRALLGWSLSELAAKAKISRNTLALMERSESARNYRSRKKVSDALAAAGVEIFPRDEAKGAGVRFRTISAEERAIAEGGSISPAADEE
jgi:transcriptional regulator with XRE-family HTH domain